METSRREFLTQASKLLILTVTAARAVEKTGTPPGPDDTYHMAEHWWGMIIDIDKCIGCGNCVRACSKENQVPDGYFRTWVERYQVTEDREHPLVESPNGAINGFPPATRDTSRASMSPNFATNVSTPRACRSARWGPPLSARMVWSWWMPTIALAAVIACRPAPTGAAFSIPKKRSRTSARFATTASPRV